MIKIWLTFTGEYEQRAAGAAFTSEELERLYSDDIEEVFVWDRPLEKRTMFKVYGVFPSQAAHDIEGSQYCASLKYDRENGWAVKRESNSCDEDSLARSAGERVEWWNGKAGPIYVEVIGDDKTHVDTRFAALQQQVENGLLSPM